MLFQEGIMRIAGMEMGQSTPSACIAFKPLLPPKMNPISTKAKDTTRAPLKPHIGK
jgi:hypothetical protein